MKDKPLFRFAIAGCLSALTLCATLFIHIPLPNGGYLNAGDAVVLISGFLLSPKLAFLSAAVGSALADIISGYTIYSPVTFIIKGAMALLVGIAVTYGKRKNHKTKIPILCFIVAELIMVIGYYIFEGFLYGFIASLPNAAMNLLQGLFGVLAAFIILSVILRRIKE